MPAEPNRPRWLVVFVISDELGNTDSFTDVFTRADLNRREALALAREQLPGNTSDPLIQRMLAWNLEATGNIHIPSARVQAVAVKLCDQAEPSRNPGQLEAADAD